jgi:hypothetical protein
MQTDFGQIAQTSEADTTDPAAIFFSRHNNQGLAISFPDGSFLRLYGASFSIKA